MNAYELYLLIEDDEMVTNATSENLEEALTAVSDGVLEGVPNPDAIEAIRQAMNDWNEFVDEHPMEACRTNSAWYDLVKALLEEIPAEC